MRGRGVRRGGLPRPAGFIPRPAGTWAPLACWAALVLFSGRALSAEIRMGVVNVSEVMSRYSRTGDLQKLHDGRFSARRQELLKRQQDLMKKAADLGTAEDADSPDRYAQIKALEREKFLIEQEGQVFQHDVKVAREKVMRLLQEEVRVACRRIAGQEGYDLILKVQESDPSQGGDRARIEAFEMSAVLYAAPSVDITARVLSFLEEAGRRGIRLAPEDLVRDATGGEAAR